MKSHTFQRMALTTTSRDVVARVSGKAVITVDDDDNTLRRIVELYVFDENRTLLEILPADPLFRPIADALQRDVNDAANSKPVDAEPESA